MTRQTSAIYQWSYWGAIQSDSGGFLNSDHTIDFPALIALYYFTDFPWQADCQAQTAFIHCLLMIAKLSLYFLQIFYWSNKDPRYPFITILNQCLDVLLIIEMIHLFSSHILVITLFHAAIRSAATIKSRTRPCLQCIIILYHCLHNKKSFEVLQQLSVDSEQRGPVCYVLTYHSSTTLADFRVWGLGTCATSPSPPRE